MDLRNDDDVCPIEELDPEDPPSPLPDGCIIVNSNPNDPDTDGDGASDGLERDLGGNPTVADL